MPSGFNFTIATPPAVEGGGDVIPRRGVRPAPTYRRIAVDSRIILIGSAGVGALVPLRVETIMPFAAIEVDGGVSLSSSVQAQTYNERDVRFVLGLPPF